MRRAVVLVLGSAGEQRAASRAAASRRHRLENSRRAFAAALTTLIPGAANAALARDAPPPPGILENRDRGLNECSDRERFLLCGTKPPESSTSKTYRATTQERLGRVRRRFRRLERVHVHPPEAAVRRVRASTMA